MEVWHKRILYGSLAQKAVREKTWTETQTNQ